ncbi:MAG: phosphohydrolase [Firmicutes bacterium]|nr:phosphohydrolase [Bacillota bacterium]
MMSSIKTYTGVMFDPVHPEVERIDILDIAHALSMLCRANGHFRSFYSVGQHCINCAWEAKARGYSERVQLACLLHDASEAYLSDVTRPVKRELPKYLEIEKPLQETIWRKYLGSILTEEEKVQVFDVDDAMLYYEFKALMDTRFSEEEPELKSEPKFEFRGFEETEERFLRVFGELSEGSLFRCKVIV